MINTVTFDNDHSEDAKALGRHINAATEAERAAPSLPDDTAPGIDRLAEAHGLVSSRDPLAASQPRGMSDREKALREKLANKPGRAASLIIP